MNGLLLILTGPSGSGKDTICAEIFKSYPDAFRIISYTTRHPRNGESDCINYHFITRDLFQKMREQGQFLEWVEYADNFYGTSKESLKDIPAKLAVLIMDPLGAARIRDVINNSYSPETAKQILDKTLIIYIDVSKEDLYKRLLKRGMDQDTLNKRLEQDKKDRRFQDKFENIIENENGQLEQTVKEVLNLIGNFKLNK